MYSAFKMIYYRNQFILSLFDIKFYYIDLIVKIGIKYVNHTHAMQTYRFSI